MKILLASSIFSITLQFSSQCLVNAQTLLIPNFRVRSYDGTDRDDDSGKANSTLIRLAPKVDINMTDESMPNPRTISNYMSSQAPSYPTNGRRLSDMVWQWGQFIDHDFALTSHSTGDTVPIQVPQPQDDSDVLANGGCLEIPFTRTDTDASGCCS